MKKILLALLIPFLLSGCASAVMEIGGVKEVGGVTKDMGKAALGGQYDQLLSATDTRYGSIEKIPVGVFEKYCNAAFLAKRYDKLQMCLAEYQVRRDRLVEARQLLNPQNCIVRFLKGSVVPEAVCKAYKEETRFRALYALDIGDYGEAVNRARWLDATKVTGPGGNFDPIYEAVDALGVLAVANALAGDVATANSYLRRLEAFPPGQIGPEVHYMQEKRTWLARSYMALGDFQRAYDAVNAIDLGAAFGRGVNRTFEFLIAGQTEIRSEATAYAFILHKAELETGRVQQAKTGFDRMLSAPAVKANGDILWLLLHDRGRIAEREGKLKEAADFYREAVDVIDAQRSTLSTETSKIGFVGSKQAVYRDLIRVLMSQGQAATAFEYVERSKARALVDMLAEKKDFVALEVNPDRVRELLAAADTAEMAVRAADSAGATDQRRALVVKAREDLAAQAPELSSLVNVSTLNLKEVQQALPKDESLVEYYYSGENLYIFVVTNGGVSGLRTSAAKLDDDVQSFRKALQAGDAGWKAHSVRLYERLIRPIKEQLRSANVTIVAHGSLHYLPFNALHDGSQFMVERYSIRLLPAATVLKFLRAPPGEKPGTLLAFGNPDLKDRRFDLAFAQAEAQNIVRVLPKSRALTRGDATKTAFRKYASDFRMLHVASHGEFDAATPLASSLLLAPDASNDGRLTVSDLYSMRVDADLVTLSACETGLGKIANGDDVVGLTRGFLYAGTRTIIASLWQVDDRATGELMTSFYESLAKGSGKRESLRSAQLGFIKTEQHPFFWAAFQLTGNP